MTQKIELHDNCFACGSKNKKGLKPKFSQEGGSAVAEFGCSWDYEGYSGLIHGGIIAMLMDEAITHAIILQGLIAMTAQMHTHYRNPVKTGSKIKTSGVKTGSKVKTSGWIKVAKTRTIQTAAQIEDDKGRIIVSAEAICIVADKALSGD